MATILDGRIVADSMLIKLRQTISNLPSIPTLAIIKVGNNPASEVYIRTKTVKAAELGIKTSVFELQSDCKEVELLRLINKLNSEKTVNGILVQSPLANPEMQERIVESIDPAKDVDGFHSSNLGKLFYDDLHGFIACTPLGILKIFEYYKIPIEGQHVVIIGRSNIVGKPLAVALLRKSEKCNATVTVCHSKTKNIKDIIRSGDIVIAALGKPNFVTADMIKQEAVVIDVGINRVDDDSSIRGYKLIGDVDFKNVSNVCSAITPVPGGVGPMTVAMLMHNTVKAYVNQKSL